MVIDSLRFWVLDMHVDGFRFDLASIFSRNNDGSINLDDPPLITEITGGAEYGDVRLIAEAWGPVSYGMGRSFPGQSSRQWKGKNRDAVRRSVKMNPEKNVALMTRTYCR